MGLMKHLDTEQLRGVFGEMDTKGDGRVDFLEWIEFVQPIHKAYRCVTGRQLERENCDARDICAHTNTHNQY